MSKSDLIELVGVVEEVLPGSMYRVKLEQMPNPILCYTGGKLKQHKPSTSKHKQCSQQCMKQAELMMQLEMGRIYERLRAELTAHIDLRLTQY